MSGTPSSATAKPPCGSHIAQRTSPGGLPDRNHFFAGEDHGTICWNTPYRKAYLEMVEHIVRDYYRGSATTDAFVALARKVWDEAASEANSP